MASFEINFTSSFATAETKHKQATNNNFIMIILFFFCLTRYPHKRYENVTKEPLIVVLIEFSSSNINNKTTSTELKLSREVHLKTRHAKWQAPCINDWLLYARQCHHPAAAAAVAAQIIARFLMTKQHKKQENNNNECFKSQNKDTLKFSDYSMSTKINKFLVVLNKFVYL